MPSFNIANSLTFHRWLSIIAGLIILLSIAITAGGFWGSETLHWNLVFSNTPSVDRDIFFLSRLPHVLLAVVVGFGLSGAGASFQGLLKNPLADPFILGVSSGAALCSVVSLALGLSFPWISFVAFGGALLSMGLVYGLASYKKRPNPQTLLLTGVVFNAFAFAFILFFNAVAPIDQVHRIITMLIGSLDAVRYIDLAVVTGLVFLGLIVLIIEARSLNLISEGVETAATFGLHPEQHMRRIFLGASLMVGAVVSLSGLIGFVGLFVPHIARRLWGPDHRILIPASALLGAIILIICDTLARTVGFHTRLETQLPVGAVTALFGAPFFLVLLRRMK